jgi:UPF0755 protein
LLLFAALFGFALYEAKQPLTGNTRSFEFYIRKKESRDEIVTRLFDSLQSQPSWSWSLANILKRSPDFKPGKYLLNGDLSAWEIINKFRSGDQEPVHIRLDDIRTPQQLAARFERQFEGDSASFMNYVNSFLVPEVKKSSDSLASFPVQRTLIFILGDTYEYWWSTTPEEFFGRLKTLQQNFWTEENMSKAKEIGLTPDEIYVLASIVKCETRDYEDARKAAGLYLNRLRMNKKLESDPTAKFDLKMRDQIQRVTNDHLRNDSPYNTYKTFGLPPAPIFVVEKKYLDAVLNYFPSNYLYMCAEPGGKGTHRYTDQYSEHLRNSQDYHAWLDSKNIH